MVCTKQQENGLRSLKPKGFKSFLFLFDRFIVIQYHWNKQSCGFTVYMVQEFKDCFLNRYMDFFHCIQIYHNSFIFEKMKKLTLYHSNSLSFALSLNSDELYHILHWITME